MADISDALALYNQGRFQEVVQICAAFESGDSGYAQGQHLLGLIAYQHGQLIEAEQLLLSATALQPREVMPRTHLGSVQCALGKLDEGIASYRRALKLHPRFADAHFNLGNALKRKGNLLQAQKCYQRALKLDPNLEGAKLNLAIVLRDQGQSVQAEKLFQTSIQQHPMNMSMASNHLFNLNYHVTDGDYLLQQHLRFAEQFADNLNPVAVKHANSIDPHRRLRIGYVSADFYSHSVAFFFEPLIRHHHRSDFELFCYSSVVKPDEVTQRFMTLADRWHDVSTMNDDAVAALVRRDEVDILIDLGGHTSIQRLLVFAQKPAPVQITYLGYPNTTGLSSIDYRMTDLIADPVGNERWHAEQLLRLPGGFLCFAAPQEAGAVVSPPSVANGYITFGCFNNMAKIQPELIQMWAAVLHALPTSRLLIKNPALSDRELQKQLLRSFRKHGIAAKRLILHGRLAAKGDHLGLYHQVDIALDSYPYNGTTTTFEALWMGVPVISLYGELHASRVGLSILSAIGLEDLAASTPEAAVAVATALADDQQRLQQLRSALRELVQKHLCDAETFTCTVEDAFREIWQRWCNSHNSD